MYKKTNVDELKKDGYKVLLPNIDYENISICFVEVSNKRKTYVIIKNCPVYYYIIEGSGNFFIDNETLFTEKGDLIEILENKKYTYSGNMKMLEVIPKSFSELNVEEENV